jgi:hypothetical protein
MLLKSLRTAGLVGLVAGLAVWVLPGAELVEPELAYAEDNGNDNGDDNKDSPSSGPNLAVGAVGFTPPNMALFKVVNLGKGVSPVTTVKLETIKPGPPNVANFNLPALAKGESREVTYFITGPCNGHEVKASVNVAGDTNKADNSATATLCGPQTSGGAGQSGGVIQSGGVTGRVGGVVAPEYMQPGTHDLSFQVQDSDVRRALHERRNADCSSKIPFFSDPESKPAVGWFQDVGARLEDSCDWAVVAQVGLKFDLSLLNGVPPHYVQSALLTFDEEPWFWRGIEFGSGASPGCVAVLGLAAVDISSPPAGLIPHTVYKNVTPGASRQWDVTAHVRDQLQNPANQSLRNGYVLAGSLGLDQLEVDDDDSCISHVQNFSLRVMLVVP